MKRFWLILSAALGLAIAVPAFADVYTVRLDASDVDIPTAFGQGSDSLVLQGIRNMRSVLIDNRGTDEVVVNCSTSAGHTPGVNQNLYIAGTSAWAIDQANLGNACFIKSGTGSAITSGIVVITVVGG